MIDWLVGWLTDWLNDWLTDWFVGWLLVDENAVHTSTSRTMVFENGNSSMTPEGSVLRKVVKSHRDPKSFVQSPRPHVSLNWLCPMDFGFLI